MGDTLTLLICIKSSDSPRAEAVLESVCFALHFVKKTLNNKYSYKFFILQYRAIQHSEIVIKCFLQCKVFVILLNFYY